MRFLHTADWHIGKKLHGFDLHDEQQDTYEQILKIAETQKVDAVVIAGDLYDRAVPGEDSVKQLNSMLIDLNLEHKFPLLAISGNHDSATRLHTGSEWFSATNFYLNTKVSHSTTPVEFNDTQFFLLPYFEPFQARQYLQDEDIKNVNQAMIKLVEEMKTQFDPAKKHVLVAHFFAAGSEHVDSETQVSVGGLNAVPIDILTDFDYVALGHLHGKDALHADKIKYSGSPVKFSISETKQTKGVWIVDTDPYHIEFFPLTPSKDIRILTEDYQTLTTPEFYNHQKRDDFLSVQLTDKKIIPNVMQQLREIYPFIINLERVNGPIQTDTIAKVDPNLDPMALLKNFFTESTDEEMSPNQEHWAASTLKNANKEVN